MKITNYTIVSVTASAAILEQEQKAHAIEMSLNHKYRSLIYFALEADSIFGISFADDQAVYFKVKPMQSVFYGTVIRCCGSTFIDAG